LIRLSVVPILEIDWQPAGTIKLAFKRLNSLLMSRKTANTRCLEPIGAALFGATPAWPALAWRVWA
jgi:hypothetical protein